MVKQIAFIISLVLTLGVFAYSTARIISFFKLTKANFPIKDFWNRIVLTFKVVLLQSKIFRKPVLGLLHAIILWGFIVIIVGSIEMTIDGIVGTERVLSVMGLVYDIIFALADVYGFLIHGDYLYYFKKKIYCVFAASFNFSMEANMDFSTSGSSPSPKYSRGIPTVIPFRPSVKDEQ